MLTPSWQQDARTIALVGLAHGTSHFFHLMLPTLFPWLIRDFGLSYSELGRLVTVFFIVSGVGQALAGFVVDRLGARRVLFVALACFALSALLAALAQSGKGLALAAAVAGLANASFHPVDFTILNQRVSVQRLGHGFSVHGIAGNLGWGATPIFLASLIALTGSWRWAVVGMGAWALVCLLILALNLSALDDRHDAGAKAIKPTAITNTLEHPLAFLRLPSVWLCFLFFFFTTMALSAVQGFAVPALMQMYHLPETDPWLALVVTGYMVLGALGMLVGGMLASRQAQLEWVIGGCLVGSAVLIWLVGRAVLPATWAMATVVLAGLGAGVAGPSRDMLVKQAAPPGATGRVYGTVYSGLDLGFALAAPALGALLDAKLPGRIFDGATLALLLSVGCAVWVGRGVMTRTQLSH